MEILWSLIYHTAAIGAIGYCAYHLGYFAGYQKCQDKYEDYLDNRTKKVYNNSNDSNS